MKSAFAALAFIARHFLFVVFLIGAGWLAWTLFYAVLLLVAMLTGSGVGGPLAYPAGLLTIGVAAVIFGWGIFAPSCAMGSWACAFLGVHRLAAIPIVFICAGILSYLFYRLFIGWMSPHPMPAASMIILNYVKWISAPLGVYWVLTEGPGLLFESLRKRWGKRCMEKWKNRWRGT